jgi:hypothetical protein
MNEHASSLAARLSDPGFTPSTTHFDELFAHLASASREEAPAVERVLARAGERVLGAVLERLPGAAPDFRARLVNVLGRLKDPRASAALRSALADSDARVQRRAANALGKLPEDPENQRALVAAWPSAAPGVRRELADALGKVGGPEARALLEAETSSDAELTRSLEKARLLLERRHSRGAATSIALDVPLGRALTVLARCRAGLAELLRAELAPHGRVTDVSDSVVALEFAGAFGELLVARTALDFGVAVPLAKARPVELPEAVAAAVTSEAASLVFQRWTLGEPRYRVTFAEGGHQRALVFAIAEAVRRRTPALVNDPRKASWELVVAAHRSEPRVVLVPLAFADPRFAYRAREVRAASHPTIAAALARAAGPSRDEVVWDPFVGSGLELVERALLGGVRELVGSDLDPRALDAARENLGRAGLQAQLIQGDAAHVSPRGVTLILTNPPMGRRLHRDGSLADLLDAFIGHAGRVLERGGRLVWLSPLPERTRRAAALAGMRGGPGPSVDMGGFEAELQILRKG